MTMNESKREGVEIEAEREPDQDDGPVTDSNDAAPGDEAPGRSRRRRPGRAPRAAAQEAEVVPAARRGDDGAAEDIGSCRSESEEYRLEVGVRAHRVFDLPAVSNLHDVSIENDVVLAFQPQ